MAEQGASVGFNIFPAIDVLGGACVRLLRGDYDAKTEYSKHPRAVAERWLAAGARFLHVVDLDAAKAGHPVNQTPIQDVFHAATEVGASVQVGGGVRDWDAIANWLNWGATRCIVGTAALTPGFMAEAVKRFGSEALVVGLDGRGGKVAVRGWLDQTDVDMVDAATALHRDGVLHALVTDVDRDGTLQGANLELAVRIQSESGLRAIASGGIRNLEDVLAARDAGLAGAIAGRSLYDGTLDLDAAIAALT